MNEQVRTRVAWLYYLENLTQAEIAQRLGLTRARVNRTLGECRESGLVRITLNSRFESCVALEQRLVGQGMLCEATIIPTPADPERLTFRKGGAALVDLPGDPRDGGRLVWYVRPRLLRALADP